MGSKKEAQWLDKDKYMWAAVIEDVYAASSDTGSVTQVYKKLDGLIYQPKMTDSLQLLNKDPQSNDIHKRWKGINYTYIKYIWQCSGNGFLMNLALLTFL